MTSSQVISTIKAAYSEVDAQDAYVDSLHQIDNTLHEITAQCAHYQSKTKQAHKRNGQIARMRESGSRVLHYKGHEPHLP
eukprot:2681381-Amphidinium_carterae.1